MKLLVPVKRVLDHNVRPRVLSDGSGIDLANVKMSMNPFDEIALEEAVRFKEMGMASEVVAVSIGSPDTRDVLRTALAMGADRAILVTLDPGQTQDLEPLAVAKILVKMVEREEPSLVIAGKQAIDNDMNATGQMLAGLLGWGQATFASAVGIEDGHAIVTREVDSGQQRTRTRLPAVITVDLRLNTPRYATLPNVMKAKKKPLEEVPVSGLGVDVAPRLSVVRVGEPPRRKAGIKLGSADELIDKLRNEAEVI